MGLGWMMSSTAASILSAIVKGKQDNLSSLVSQVLAELHEARQQVAELRGRNAKLVAELQTARDTDPEIKARWCKGHSAKTTLCKMPRWGNTEYCRYHQDQAK